MTQDPQQDIDFNKFYECLSRRRWIAAAAFAATMAVASYVTFTETPVYQATSLLIIEKERGAGAIFANGALIESKNDDYYQTQYRLMRSYTLMEKVYRAHDLDKVPEFSQPLGVEKLLDAVIINPLRGSRLVQVNVQSQDPKLGVRIANAIAEHYVAQNLEYQIFISQDVLRGLQAKEGNPNSRRTLESIPNVVNSLLIQGLKADFAKLQSQYADLSEKVTDRHPSMISLKSTMATLEEQIRAETDRVIQSLKNELSGQLRGNNVRIVDPALEPREPLFPNPRKNLSLALVGGLILAIIAAFAADLLDQSVRTQADVETKLNRPFLGLLPQAPQKTAASFCQMMVEPKPSLTSECFRNLRTMVDFARVSTKSNAFLVTSALEGEGKTYISSGIGAAMAYLGENVLVIGGDLRRPTLHRNFSRSNQRGLSEFLSKGKRVEEIEELLAATDIPTLKILPSGTRPPNPSELLNTPRLEALVTWAKSRFDRVIVDCTPAYPVNDVMLWGRHIPSALFVVRFGATRAPLASDAIAKLETAGIELMGVAINAAKTGSLGYYSRYQYHQHDAYHQHSDAEPARRA